MPNIQYPTINVKYYAIQDVFLRADDVSVAQYSVERNLNSPTYKSESQRFSNDGGLSYQYYGLPVGVTGGTSEWVTEFGFSKIVTELTYS